MDRKATFRCSVALGVLALASSMAEAQDAPAPATASAPAEDDIVVTGIRGSILSAKELKREADVFADAVTAQDLTKFSDENLAEALQRVPGVQVARDGGEGRRVTVRGLGSQFNRVMVNGRTAVSAGTEGRTETRSFNFDVIPTEIITSTIVYKSASADLEEGGIGASVDIRTVKPLDLKVPNDDDGNVTVLGVRGLYDDFADKLGYRASAFGSYRLTDSFGIAFSLVANERRLREDMVVVNQLNQATVNVAGTPRSGPRPNIVDANLIDEKRKRYTGTLALQWRPTDTLELSFDGLYSKYDTLSDRQRGIIFTREIATATSATQGAGGAFTQLAGANVRVATGAVEFDNLTDFYALGGAIKWTPENWAINADLSYSRNEFHQSFIPVAVSINSGPYTYDATDGIKFKPTADLSNPALYGVGVAASGNNVRNRQIFADVSALTFAASAERFLDAGIVKSLKVGGTISRLKYDAESFDTGTVTVTGNFQPLLTPVPVDNFFPSNPALGLGNRVGVDLDAFKAQYPALLASDPPADLLNSYGAREKTVAGFAKLLLEADGAKGDIGVRVVHTEQDSNGFNVQTGRAPLPVALSRSYTYALPSANFRFDLSERLLLRVAAGQTLTRAELKEIAPYTQIVDRANLIANVGNPDLKPFRATSLDLGLEYYQPNGNSLSIAGFYKFLDSFIAPVTAFAVPPGETATFRVTRSENLAGGDLWGFEVAGSLFFDFLPTPLDGLGLQATYTYVDTNIGVVDTVSGAKQPIPGISKHNVNLVGSYEKGPVSLRVAYNRRSEFVNQAAGNAALIAFYTLPLEQVDANLTVRITDRLTASVDATNLFDENERQELGTVARYYGSRKDAGRRFAVGLNYRF